MKEYNNLIEAYEKLNIKDKRKEITEEIKELLAVFCLLSLEKGITEHPLLHSNMNDNEMGTEEDFLNSTYSYLISIKEMIGRYFDEDII